MRSNIPVLNVYQKQNKKSEVVTQLLYGDSFKKMKKNKLWIKIKNDSDNYNGYIINKNFPPNQKNTHKIFTLSANLYSKPNNSNKIKKKLSFGSKIKVIKKKGIFYKFDKFWIKKNSLIKINIKARNNFQNINKFINVKYKWGGKHYSGVDCSGLVQLFMNLNNKFCPRDAGDQKKFLKKKVKLNNIRKNDLIFWKGHVAVIISKNKLIHSYGPFKSVVVMPIKKTIDRIFKTAKLKVTGIRRLN